MITQSFLDFLNDLSQNNNRDWFEQNKPRFQNEVKKPFDQAVAALIEEIKAIEPGFELEPKNAVFRIYRDTRFSKDKTPYKTHMGAILVHGGRKQMHQPGYYVHIEYGRLQMGGGAYFLEKDPLAKVRTAIMQDPEAFRSVIEAPDFVEKYGEIKGEKNKILKPPFKEAAESEPLLFNKQFYYMADVDPQHAIGEGFAKFAAEYFKAGAPVNEYFRAAIK